MLLGVIEGVGLEKRNLRGDVVALRIYLKGNSCKVVSLRLTLKCTKGGSGWTSGIFHRKDVSASQGDNGVTILAIVQKVIGHGSWCHDLVDVVVFSQRWDSMILEVFSNLNDSNSKNMIKHRNRLPVEVTDALNVLVFKMYLDNILSNVLLLLLSPELVRWLD